MGGHSSKGMTFQEPAAVTPPPVPDFIVTGDGNPSPNGNYFLDGFYDGFLSYKHESENFYIWRWGATEEWYLSTIKGDSDNVPSWLQDPSSESPAGEYRDYNYSTGTLTISIP